MNKMLNEIVDALWEEIYVEGDKFIKEKEMNHLANMDKLAETIYYINKINKGEGF